MGFYPTYLTDVKGLSPAISSALFETRFATPILIRPVAGFEMDRFGPRRTPIATPTPITIGLWLLPFAGALVHLLLGSLSGSGMITQAVIAVALPADRKGAGLGMLRGSWITSRGDVSGPRRYSGGFGYRWESFFLLAGICERRTVVGRLQVLKRTSLLAVRYIVTAVLPLLRLEIASSTLV